MPTFFRKIPVALACLIVACSDADTSNSEPSIQDSASLDDDGSSNLLPASDSILYDSSFDHKQFNLTTNQPVPKPTSEVNVVIHQMSGYGQDEAFARAAADSLKAVLNSTGFKRCVLNTSFNYHNRELSAQQIYDLIMKAHEEDGPGGKDSVLDLRLRIITLEEDEQKWINACNGSTIGIDGSGSGVSAVCPGWLRSTAQTKHYSWLAAHFIHEYMHILNFRHPSNKLQSVPYKIHQIVENLIEEPALRL